MHVPTPTGQHAHNGLAACNINMADANKGKQVLGTPASQGTGAGLRPLTPVAKISVAAGSKRSSTPLSRSFNKRPASQVAAPTGVQPYLTGRVMSSKVVISKNQARSDSLEFISRADGRVHHIHTSPPKDAVSGVKRGKPSVLWLGRLHRQLTDTVLYCRRWLLRILWLRAIQEVR